MWAGLTGLHLVFVRLHNKIAAVFYNKLKSRQPYWSAKELDEKVYQETRRVVGALLQVRDEKQLSIAQTQQTQLEQQQVFLCATGGHLRGVPTYSVGESQDGGIQVRDRATWSVQQQHKPRQHQRVRYSCLPVWP